MRSKKKLCNRVLAWIMTASMALSLCPSTVFAVTGSDVAADGTYTVTKSVSEAYSDAAGYQEDDDWTDYTVTVSLTVADGVFSAITISSNLDDDDDSVSYFNKAATKGTSKYTSFVTALTGESATADTINSWDCVSGATCTSETIRAAAVEALASAETASTESTDTEDSTDDTGSTGTEDTTEDTGSTGTEDTTEDTGSTGTEDTTEDTGSTDTGDTTDDADDTTEEAVYVLMNIPYADFYEAEVNNDVAVDGFTSATLNKSRTNTVNLAGGSYHVDSEGTDITGITYPVKVSSLDVLADCKQVTDDDSVTISVTNRGTTSETTYTGSDALFENESYAYYVLSEEPSYYKELTVEEDGSLSFGAVIGVVTEATVAIDTFTTDTTYGDYQMDLALDDRTGIFSEDATIYGVVLHTEEGSDYGLRHVENIWKQYELAWCTGFTTAVHNCPTSSAHYEAIMGQTINSVTYYTSEGIYLLNLESAQYVPITTSAEASVEDVVVGSESITVTITDLPDGFTPVFTVDGTTYEATDNGDGTYTIAYSASTTGSYDVVVSDQNGAYTELTTSFEVYSEDIPDFSADDVALVKTDSMTDDEFTAYIAAISTVSLNGTSYSATGRSATTVVNEDGSLVADLFEADTLYEVIVSATGYADLTFYVMFAENGTATEYLYLLMNIPYEDFYDAEIEGNDVDVDGFTSATLNKTRTSTTTLAAGTYHVDTSGTDITGITYPVLVSVEVDLSGCVEVTDNDTVTISVTNRGKTSETTYTGSEALFENESYAYYVLSETPSWYKVLTVDESENFVFGEVQAETTAISASGTISTESSYGDYEIDLDVDETCIDEDTTVYGVVIHTEEGSDYGLRHLENIWARTKLAWCVGYTTAVHNCPTSSAHYEAIVGQTITGFTYYTSDGVYELTLNEAQYVATLLNEDNDDVSVTVDTSNLTYDGTSKEPDVTVTVDGTVLTLGTDYTVTYSDNVNAGTGTVTITGIGNYAGSVTAEFTIKPASIKSAKVELSKTTYIYGAKERKPGTTVTLGDVTLVKGTDYTVTYTNNVDVGIATATITGTGNYTGTVTRTYTITGQAISKVTLSSTSYTYSGNAKKPSVTVKSSAGKTLTAGTDYSITYSSNTNIGTAKVTIKGKGNYVGTTIVKTFTIKPGKVSIKSVKSSAKKKLTVSWAEQSGNVRYQIAYKAKSSDTWKYKTVSSSTLKKTISGLKSGKTYQVKVRAYKSVKGRKYYGSWSGIKTVNVK